MVLNDRLHSSVYCLWEIFANPILSLFNLTNSAKVTHFSYRLVLSVDLDQPPCRLLLLPLLPPSSSSSSLSFTYSSFPTISSSSNFSASDGAQRPIAQLGVLPMEYFRESNFEHLTNSAQMARCSFRLVQPSSLLSSPPPSSSSPSSSSSSSSFSSSFSDFSAFSSSVSGPRRILPNSGSASCSA